MQIMLYISVTDNTHIPLYEEKQLTSKNKMTADYRKKKNLYVIKIYIYM